MRYRIARLNEVVRLVYSLGGGSSESQNGKIEEKIGLSSSVSPDGDFSNHLMEDLKKLSRKGDLKSVISLQR